MKLTHEAGYLWKLESADNPEDFIWVRLKDGRYSFSDKTMLRPQLVAPLLQNLIYPEDK